MILVLLPWAFASAIVVGLCLYQYSFFRHLGLVDVANFTILMTCVDATTACLRTITAATVGDTTAGGMVVYCGLGGISLLGTNFAVYNYGYRMMSAATQTHDLTDDPTTALRPTLMTLCIIILVGQIVGSLPHLYGLEGGIIFYGITSLCYVIFLVLIFRAFFALQAVLPAATMSKVWARLKRLSMIMTLGIIWLVYRLIQTILTSPVLTPEDWPDFFVVDDILTYSIREIVIHGIYVGVLLTFWRPHTIQCDTSRR